MSTLLSHSGKPEFILAFGLNEETYISDSVGLEHLGLFIQAPASNSGGLAMELEYPSAQETIESKNRAVKEALLSEAPKHFSPLLWL